MTEPVVLSLLDQPDNHPQQSVELTLPVPDGWPPAPAHAAYHGLAGEIVNRIAPHTEADRATRGRTLRVNDAIGGSTDVMLSA
jgi:hypothetical protein